MSPATAQPLAYEFEMFDQPRIEAEQLLEEQQQEPTWTAAEVEAIRASAFAEGEAAGREAEQARIEKQHAEAAAAISAALKNLFGELSRIRIEHEDASARLALTAGRALAGAALSEAAETIIGTMIQEALERLETAVRVTIDVHPSMRVSAQHVIDDAVAATGYEGRVILRDSDGHPGDCRVDWGDGGIERCLADINAAIEDRFGAHYPNGPSGDGDPGVPEAEQ